MRTVLLVCLFVAAAPLAGRAQDSNSSDKPTRKGDPLTVKGCLSGNALEATETSAIDASALLAGGLTFRLTGDKALLKELRQKHEGKVVEVKGVLKSNLPQQDPQTRNIGRVRVGIGSPAATPGTPQAEARRSVPVLEVKSFDGSATTSCGR